MFIQMAHYIQLTQSYQTYLYSHMRNKKFSLTGYEPFRSTKLRQNSPVADYVTKLKHPLHRSTFFKRDTINKSKQNAIDVDLTKNQYVFSLQKLSFDRKKEQRQLLENVRSPNFNIKRFFDKSLNKKCHQSQHDMSNSCSLSNKRQTTARPILRRHWQRYLNEEITYADLTKELNKNIIDLNQRSKKTQSQFKCKDKNPNQNPNKLEKSAFYINNFIKTTYKKRRFQHKLYQEQQARTKQHIKTVKPIQTSTIKRKIDELNQKNWSMIPWQKDHDIQYQEQFIPL